jgi:excinuclease ABC subunit B
MTDTLVMAFAEEQTAYNSPDAVKKRIAALEKKMLQAAANLEFEEAGRLRDELRRMEAQDLGLTPLGMAPPQLSPPDSMARQRQYQINPEK